MLIYFYVCLLISVSILLAPAAATPTSNEISPDDTDYQPIQQEEDEVQPGDPIELEDVNDRSSNAPLVGKKSGIHTKMVGFKVK